MNAVPTRIAMCTLLAVSSLSGALGCSSDGTCGSIAVGTGGYMTDLDLVQCWDGQDRNVHCEPVEGAAGRVTCSCSVGGNVGATFERTEPLSVSMNLTEAELGPINAGCHWELRPR